jgi:succinoglycan biosynthesis transport protein ExoP
MLHINNPPRMAPAHEQHSQAQGYPAFLGFLRRQFSVIAGVLLLSITVGVLYLINTPPSFTAQATMIIDTRKSNVFQQQAIIGDIQVDSATVESQVEVLRSENIALAVIKQLHLSDDPEFVGPGGGLVGSVAKAVSGWFQSNLERSETDKLRAAADAFATRLNVKRVGLTYIIEISFRSLNAARSAQIANSVADAYIADQLNAKYEATQRASVWLQARIAELRNQSSSSERAIVDFKAKNNIVNSGGRSMGEQQLSEVNTQLILARSQTAEAKARLDRINEIVRAEPDATVTDTLRSEVITKLRQNYLELKGREADWSARYGPNHQAAVQLRNQMQEIRRSIVDELQRYAQTYKSDYEIAKQRELALEKGLSSVVSDSQVTDQAQVSLRELESSAQTYRTLYNNFLQRYTESVQQQSFPITEARVITAASAPLFKSSPRPTLTMLMATFIGLALGLGVGRLRDLSDRTFRTGDQVEAVLDVNCVGILPDLTRAAVASDSQNTAAVRPVGLREISHQAALYAEVINSPFSRYTEGIRAIKVAADLTMMKKSNRVVGITSTLPNEGKSTIAVSLAQLMAQGGAKVLLIDADLRNPSLSRRVAGSASLGLIEVVRGEASFGDVKWHDPVTKLDFLPAVLNTRIAHTNEILASEAMKDLFDELKVSYDYVIVDLSPLAPVIDVRITEPLIDSYVYVIEWGRTRIDAVEHALADAKNVYENLVGVVLNKANIATLSRYEAYKGSYYYNKHYSRYQYGD